MYKDKKLVSEVCNNCSLFNSCQDFCSAMEILISKGIVIVEIDDEEIKSFINNNENNIETPIKTKSGSK